MQTLMIALPAALAAYLLGSVPFAVLSSKMFGLADPRTYGSGNPGATNVLRSGNKLAALVTLIGDAAKGWLAVMIASAAGLPDDVVALVALAVFVGHLFPVFLKFRGGKGVATAAGVLLALDPALGIVTLAVWLLVAYLSGYSSLAALIAAAQAPIVSALMHGIDIQFLAVMLIALGLIAKHWANIQRLMTGQESRIGSKKKA